VVSLAKESRDQLPPGVANLFCCCGLVDPGEPDPPPPPTAIVEEEERRDLVGFPELSITKLSFLQIAFSLSHTYEWRHLLTRCNYF
jgi:hypothetical protein